MQVDGSIRLTGMMSTPEYHGKIRFFSPRDSP
jgi:hypothetical protein